MADTGLEPLLVSPIQAANTFSQAGRHPRQRNVFLVRFILNGQGTQNALQALTFAAKSIDRPRVNPKTEELNEYNKRRQVFTGYKLEAIRVSFYDSADGAAQNMWMNYARYYFGDFNAGSSDAYSYDATMPEFKKNGGNGFGFTGNNGGQGDGDGMFYFHHIELYHFYDQMVDCYHIINPRITSFEPDDLDYENSSISLINAQFVYENLQYFPQQRVNIGNFWEFEQGSFYGNPLVIPDTGQYYDNAANYNDANYATNTGLGALLGGIVGSFNPVLDYRFGSKRSGGSLGLFGNFAFGPGGVSLGVGLTAAAFTKSGLGAALSMGVSSDPLATTSAVMYNAQARAARGFNGSQYDYMAGQASRYSTGYGNVTDAITSGLLASAALGGSRPGIDDNGIIYHPNVYGAINARQTGTAQYGYNTQTTPQGYTGPYGTENNGPYNAYQPAGIYGRYGITEEPLAPPGSQ